MEQLDIFSVIAAQDAALERGETITFVSKLATTRRTFAHNPSCQGQYACRCDGRGKGGIVLIRPARGTVEVPDTREPAETLPRARQAAVALDGDTIASLSPARVTARVGLARHVDAGR